MKLTGIKETCLYVKNLERTKDFYSNVLGLSLISYRKERHVFFRIGQDVLLCFDPEATKKEKELPPHFAEGKMHLAFEAPGEEYEAWKHHLRENGVELLHEQGWKDGKKSIYFPDPDGNLLEILQPGIWDE